jgi:hypothetical protein
MKLAGPGTTANNMANAKNIIGQTVKEEGGFQNDPADSGNFLNGVNYGTKYGITPAAFLLQYKTLVKPDTIKNLTIDQAIPIYKNKYWDKIRGDEIENDSLAALMMFSIVNSGLAQIKVFKKLINLVLDKNVVAETSDPFTHIEITILNDLDQQLYFDLLKTTRKRFYENLVKADPGKQKYLKGWLNRLENYQFVPEKKNP